jgi:uncharacterized RDD family membrane protein YckC
MKMEKAELMSHILIIVGMVLLILTFVMAVILVTSELGILSQSDLSQALGEILGPIAAAIIRVLYLGIMGWTGSIATIRGIQLYKEAKRLRPVETETSKEQE